MVKHYINTYYKNILKYIAKYFPHFRYLLNANFYTTDHAAEA